MHTYTNTYIHTHTHTHTQDLHPKPLDQGDSDGRQISENRNHGDGEVFDCACRGIDHDRKQRCVVRVIELTLVLGNNSLEIGFVFQERVLRSIPSPRKKSKKKKYRS